MLSVSKVLLACLFFALLQCVSHLGGIKEDKRDRKAKVSSEKLKRAAVCNAAEDTKASRQNGSLGPQHIVVKNRKDIMSQLG